MISEEMTSSNQQDLTQKPPSVHARPPEQQHQLGTRPAHHDDGITIIKIQNPQTPDQKPKKKPLLRLLAPPVHTVAAVIIVSFI